MHARPAAESGPAARLALAFRAGLVVMLQKVFVKEFKWPL
jgi:hypothetical protein